MHSPKEIADAIIGFFVLVIGLSISVAALAGAVWAVEQTL